MLAPLRSKAEKTLNPLRETRSNETDKSDEHAAKLPEALKSFTPLASEQEIKGASKGLHELELAVARAPTSVSSIAALQSQLDVLAERTRAKISERTTEQADLAPLISASQAAIAAGNKDFESIYGGVNKVIESGEGDGLKAYGAAIVALAADVQKGVGEAKQRDAGASVYDCVRLCTNNDLT